MRAAQASEAAAAQSSLVARETPQTRAPAPGLGEQARVARLTWQKQLAAHLDRAKRYPAEGGGRSATVTLKFRLDRAGHVLKAEAAPGDHDAAFEAAALDMMKRADPAPAPPPGVADDELTFVLPIIFRSKGKI
jgi:TonB family protein